MKKSILQIISTGLGVGYSPVLPGTLGTLVGLGIFLSLSCFQEAPPLVIWIGGATIIFTGLSLLTGRWAESHFKKKDPPQFVLDEMAGLGCALLLIPFTWTWWLAAFCLFRFFDIVKPFPIGKIQKYPGGWGIVLDDILAGVYANLLLQMALLIL